jgi:hypothetical protein
VSPRSAGFSVRGIGVRLEDLALATIILGTPHLGPLQQLVSVLGDSHSSAGGLVALLAVLGAIAAVVTRIPGEARVEPRRPGADAQRLWMIGPFIGAVGFISVNSLGRLGLPGVDLLVAAALIAVVASVFLTHRLPVVPRTLRRLLVAPFVLLSGAFFQSLLVDVVDGLGGESGPIAGLRADPVLLVYILLLVVIAAGIFYMMLVFVPRELADPGGSTGAWAVRFVLFVASLLAAILIEIEVPVVLF